jgi:hypothetical protein
MATDGSNYYTKIWLLLAQELEELVYTRCELGPRHIVKNEFDLFLKDKKPLKVAEWPIILASEESKFVDIFIHFKDDSTAHDSDPEGDYYLLHLRRPTLQRQNVIYPRVQRQSTRQTQYKRGASYNVIRPEFRRRSTIDPMLRMSRYERPVIYEDHHHFQNENRVRAANISTDGNEGPYGAVGTQPSRTKPKEKEHNSGRASPHNHEDSSPTKDVHRSRPFNRQVTIPTESSEQPIVAEPETYDSNPKRELRTTYVADNDMELVRYERQQAPIQVIRPLSYSEQPQIRRNEISAQPIRGLLPPSRRHSSFVENPQSAMIRTQGLRETKRDDPPPQYSHTDARRRETIDVRPRHEEMRSEDLMGQTNKYFSGDIQGRPKPPPYRRSRGRPTADHVVSNSTNDNEIESDIYYVPKRKKEHIPAISVDDGDNAARLEQSKTKPRSNKSRSKQGRANSPDARESFGRPSNSQRKRKSRSFKASRPAPPVKPSVLPILMWPPIGSEEDINEPRLGNVQTNDFFGQNDSRKPHMSSMKGPPRTSHTNQGNGTSRRDDGDSSLKEVLERIHDSLLMEKSALHLKLFTGMEPANRTDAVFNIQEPSGPVPEAKRGGERKGETTGARSKHESTGEFLNGGPVNDRAGERKEVLEYKQKLHQFSTVANEVLECFVPPSYPHQVIDRYYGSLKKIIKVIKSSCALKTFQDLTRQ